MKYKIYLDAILCDRNCCKLIKAFDLGIEEYGVPVTISFNLNQEPTKEIIEKIIEKHKESKDNKELKKYFTNIKLNRIETILDK